MLEHNSTLSLFAAFLHLLVGKEQSKEISYFILCGTFGTTESIWNFVSRSRGDANILFML